MMGNNRNISRNSQWTHELTEVVFLFTEETAESEKVPVHLRHRPHTGEEANLECHCFRKGPMGIWKQSEGERDWWEHTSSKHAHWGAVLSQILSQPSPNQPTAPPGVPCLPPKNAGLPRECQVHFWLVPVWPQPSHVPRAGPGAVQHSLPISSTYNTPTKPPFFTAFPADE